MNRALQDLGHQLTRQRAQPGTGDAAPLLAALEEATAARDRAVAVAAKRTGARLRT